jgi:hypothetical protein
MHIPYLKFIFCLFDITFTWNYILSLKKLQHHNNNTKLTRTHTAYSNHTFYS